MPRQTREYVNGVAGWNYINKEMLTPLLNAAVLFPWEMTSVLMATRFTCGAHLRGYIYIKVVFVLSLGGGVRRSGRSLVSG